MFLNTIFFIFSITSIGYVCKGQQCGSTCTWVNWGPWSSCSTSCGGFGRRSKSRGLCCPTGSSYTDCAINCGRPLDGSHYTESCSRTCSNGGTIKPGEYFCLCPETYTGVCCEQEKPRRQEPDGNAQCNELCEWSPWEPWSTCSVSCGGGGEQQRARYLCCLEEYGGFQNCANVCGKDISEQNETRSCGDLCLTGGSLKASGFGCDCLDRSFGHCCEQLLPGCIPFPTDVIFVLDSSASQTKEQFSVQLDFVFEFVKNVDITAEEFQIAVVTYATDAKVEIDFDMSQSVDTLRQLIKNIKFRPGATFTHTGLLAATEVARKNERLKGMVTLTYAFVLTDGMSNKRTETRVAAAQLKNADVHVIAIGIGQEVSHQELHDIASPGDSFSPSYVFSAGDFNALDTLLKQLVHVTCDDCSSISHLSDIVFLLDESAEMNEAEFQLSIDVMESIVKRTDHIGEVDGPLFGLMQLGNDIESIIGLSDAQTQQTLLVELQTLHTTQDDICVKDRQCMRENITSAVEFVIESVFENTGRQNSRKFLVIISSGRFQNTNSIQEEMSAINKQSDVQLFVIGPGLYVEMDGLLSLAKEANHVYATFDEGDLSKLDIMQSEFAYNYCKKK